MKNLIILIALILLVSLHTDARACEGIVDQIKDLRAEIEELQSDLNTCRMEEKQVEEDAKQDEETEAPEETYDDQEADDDTN